MPHPMLTRLPTAVLPAAALAALLAAAPLAGLAQAQTDAFPADFLEGVYSSEDSCASGVDLMRDDGVTYLDDSGLQAIEYNCAFLHFHGVPEVRAFIAITACSAPGELTPETILVRDLENIPGEGVPPAERVGVVYQGRGEVETVFHRCPE